MQKTARFLPATTFSVALAFGAVALAAQARPSNATGECKDGTFTSATSKSGACSGHGGVKTWFADESKADAKGVKEDTKSVGKSTKGLVKSAGSATKDAAKDAGGATKDAAKATGDAAKKTGNATAKGATTAADATKDAAATAGKATAKGATAAGNATKDAAETTGKAAAKGGTAAGNATKDAADSVKNAVKPRPSDAPQDATAKCKDGTYSHAKQHSGACSGHGGVAEWYQ
jgi:uncharacterized protein DUF3761